MTSTQAYVVHEANQPFILETIHIDELGDRELLVELVAFSVCHSDLTAASGEFFLKPPMIPGHEASGYVKHVGSLVTSVKPGDAVVLGYSSCGLCDQCLHGGNPYCEHFDKMNFSGRRLNGSFAIADDRGKPLNSFFFGQSSMSKLVLAHESSAVKVLADREELKMFAPLACGIQTGAGTVLNVLQPRANAVFAVFGGGAVGLAACLAARLSSPAMIILIDISAEKLNLVPSDWGITTVSSASLSETELAAKLLSFTNGRGVDYAIDAVGSGQVLKDAHAALAPRGTLVIVGGSPESPEFSISDHLRKGANLRGTHQGDAITRTFIPKLINLWRQDLFPFDRMITYFPFHDLNKALEEMKAGRVIKPVLVVEE